MSTTIDEISMTISLLDKRLKEISERVSALELGGGKRHTHSTNACFEDSIAVCADIIMEEEKQ